MIDLSQIAITVVTSIITVIIVFYIKEFLAEKNAYKQLRKKLENIAGKNSTIVYRGAGDVGGTLYKIIEVGKDGIFIENPVHKIFLPISNILHQPMILPVDDYKTLKETYENEQLERASSKMFEPLLSKIEESIEKNVAEPNSEISNSIESRVILILEERGMLVEREQQIKAPKEQPKLTN